MKNGPAVDTARDRHGLNVQLEGHFGDALRPECFSICARAGSTSSVERKGFTIDMNKREEIAAHTA
jgi:hypothetical protein